MLGPIVGMRDVAAVKTVTKICHHGGYVPVGERENKEKNKAEEEMGVCNCR